MITLFFCKMVSRIFKQNTTLIKTYKSSNTKITLWRLMNYQKMFRKDTLHYLYPSRTVSCLKSPASLLLPFSFRKEQLRYPNTNEIFRRFSTHRGGTGKISVRWTVLKLLLVGLSSVLMVGGMRVNSLLDDFFQLVRCSGNECEDEDNAEPETICDNSEEQDEHDCEKDEVSQEEETECEEDEVSQEEETECKEEEIQNKCEDNEDNNNCEEGTQTAAAPCKSVDCDCECIQEIQKDIAKNATNSRCLHRLDCEEEMLTLANRKLENALKDVKYTAVSQTEVAMKAYHDAFEVMKEYLNIGYYVIDKDDFADDLEHKKCWHCVTEIAQKRCTKVIEALGKAQCAWILLNHLYCLIENGKACKYTKCNPLLISAEQVLECAKKELSILKQRMDDVKGDTTDRIMMQYKDDIEKFKNELKNDVKPMLEGRDIQFLEQERTILVDAALKKVMKKQAELAQEIVNSGKAPKEYRRTCC